RRGQSFYRGNDARIRCHRTTRPARPDPVAGYDRTKRQDGTTRRPAGPRDATARGRPGPGRLGAGVAGQSDQRAPQALLANQAAASATFPATTRTRLGAACQMANTDTRLAAIAIQNANA